MHRTPITVELFEYFFKTSDNFKRSPIIFVVGSSDKTGATSYFGIRIRDFIS